MPRRRPFYRCREPLEWDPRMTLARRTVLATAAASLAFPARAADWTSIEQAARGKPVFWNAWAGDDRTNAFIAWVGEQVRASHAIDVHHVRLRDTSEAVARVVAEKAAGRTEGGSVDLVWINGPNFLSMKEQGLLFGPVLDTLPNAALVERVTKPTVVDFTVPTEGFEIPWRMARVVFIADGARVKQPPRSMAALGAWATANPGRLAHPHPRNFLGATFLKQALVELAPDRAALASPAGENFTVMTAPLWAWYTTLRPALWRRGTNFPEGGAALRALLNDGEIDIMISFNPAEAVSAIASGTLPPTVRTFMPDGGTIGNCSFNAIAFNAANREAAMVLANFLLSPVAQARAADPEILGSPTVLALDRLPQADRARFAAARPIPALLTDAELGPALPEPHPTWMTRLTAEWERRFAA